MPAPDYQHSIVNLMAAIGEARGATTPYPPLPVLADAGLETARNLVLLVIDGLGRQYLDRYPDSLLAHHSLGTLTSAFPSTTATAVTSFATGLAPQQHGVTGWFMYLRELGLVTATLPFTSRLGGPTLDELLPGSERLLRQDSLYARMSTESHTVMPAYIADSVYSRATSDGARRHPYATLAELVEQVAKLAHGPGGPRYIYAYWPELDARCHRHGVDSPQVASHFADLDAAFEQLLERLAGSDSCLLATADHGLIDTAPERVIDVADHPELRDMLALPPCGEPRTAYCYLRPGAEEAFLAYTAEQLADACEARASEALIDEGWFGTGVAHPRLHQRVGDYTLMMKDNYVFTERLSDDRPFPMRGVHGGTSAAEMLVPLIYARP